MKDTQLNILAVLAVIFVAGMVYVRLTVPKDEALFAAMTALVGGVVSVIYRHMDGSTTSPTPPLPEGTTGKTTSEVIQTVEAAK